MTTATLVAGIRTTDTMDRPRRSLEELVDQLFAAMGFKEEEPRAATQTASAETAEPSATRSIHEARRLRQAGDVDTAHRCGSPLLARCPAPTWASIR